MQNGVRNNERKGQGKKIDERIAETIVSTLVYQWIGGARKQQLSAESLLSHMSEEQPHLEDYLPSPQTVRRIIKPIRQRLEEDERVGDSDRGWSIGVVDDGIDEDALPLLLRINRRLALEVGEERQRNQFASNRLTVREARWVTKLRKTVRTGGEGDERNARSIDAIRMTDLAKRYATRELVAHILGEEIDTYDLVMEVAFNSQFSPFPLWTDESQLRLLAIELGLIPPSTVSNAAETLEHSLNYPVSDMRDSRGNDLRTQLAEARLSGSLFDAIARLRDRGIILRIRFSTEDWQPDRWSRLARPFGSSADYEITPDILRLILPLARVDGEVADSDQDQVKIATAFLQKVVVALVERLRDPTSKAILGAGNEQDVGDDSEADP